MDTQALTRPTNLRAFINDKDDRTDADAMIADPSVTQPISALPDSIRSVDNPETMRPGRTRLGTSNDESFDIELADLERQIGASGINSRELGRLGEDYACQWLRQRNWRILARNWRSRFGELDIIALDPEAILVFVEVKTRRTGRFGSPEEAVGPRKQTHLRRAAVQWLISHDRDPSARHRGTRFDVISLSVKSDPGRNIHSESPYPLASSQASTEAVRGSNRSGRGGWNPGSVFLRHTREAF
ncbi:MULTISPECIES: YraN family protein [Bifidobacterium]|uniref:YraN family protein n=3 Tax=Bifidobacterium TaxID=1678 RepID=UPI002FC9891E